VTIRQPGPPPARSRGGATSIWRLTAWSGVALLVLIAAHMVANHFVVESVGGLRSYDQVVEYLANPVMLTVEIAFLIVVTIHAMLGLRSVLFDLTGDDRRRRMIDRGLVTLGVLTIAYGLVLVLTLASRA
jgi:succinate dehydrogenase hydrophobic anchor subunit